MLALDSLTGLGTLERVLDLVGVFAFAVSGATLAVRKRFDVVGVVVLGLVTSLGGGVLRDVLLGLAPPTAFDDPWYLAVAAGAGGLAMVGAPLLERIWRPVFVFDALGLGLFAIVGTVRGVDNGWSTVSAALLGVTTAIGGGVMRDVLAREVPMVFGSVPGLYAIPATGGALATALAWNAGYDGPVTAAIVGISVAMLRLVSVRRGWRAPVARNRPAS